MTRSIRIATILLLALTCRSVDAQSIDLTLGFERFEQQVKEEIGGARGERLVEESRLGLGLVGSYELHENLSVGAFVRFDIGSRSAARFDRFDSTGAAIVTGQVGGGFSEIWVGPLLRAQWRQLHLDIGYGAVGLRSDDARSDLPSSTGDTVGSFSTSPTVAWLIALGGSVPITDNLDLLVTAEYRLRYYTRRSGDPILDNLEHGTQSLVPLVGIRWSW